jgi:hypothetical protein
MQLISVLRAMTVDIVMLVVRMMEKEQDSEHEKKVTAHLHGRSFSSSAKRWPKWGSSEGSELPLDHNILLAN